MRSLLGENSITSFLLLQYRLIKMCGHCLQSSLALYGSDVTKISVFVKKLMKSLRELIYK